ncbi:MAG: GGDEF domain-containing protein [Oscillospiraceae bacterium]
MKAWLKKKGGGPLAPALRPGFDADLFQKTHRPVLAVCFALLLREGAGIALRILNNRAALPPLFAQAGFKVYVLLFTASAAYLLIAVWLCLLHRRPAQWFFGACAVFAYCACTFGGLLSACSHLTPGPTVSAFLYCLLPLALVLALRLWQALLLYGACLATLLGLVCLVAGGGAGRIPLRSKADIFAATALAIALSSLHYRRRAGHYAGQNELLEENAALYVGNLHLQRQVLTDELTKSYNRRFLETVLPGIFQTARQKNRPVAVMMADIDFFKQFNDLYGHDTGDLCLRRVAQTMRSLLPRQECYFLRYGGEEFVLFAAGCSAAQAMQLAHTLRENVSCLEIPNENTPQGHITVSIGLCYSPAGERTSLRWLIHCADRALYQAKAEGRNTVHCHSHFPAVPPANFFEGKAPAGYRGPLP